MQSAIPFKYRSVLRKHLLIVLSIHYECLMKSSIPFIFRHIPYCIQAHKSTNHLIRLVVKRQLIRTSFLCRCVFFLIHSVFHNKFLILGDAYVEEGGGGGSFLWGEVKKYHIYSVEYQSKYYLKKFHQ